MNAPALVAAGLVATAAGVAAVKLWPAKGQVSGPLSARRRFVLDSIAKVVPSAYGSENFKRIAPGYDPDDPALPHGFTTCGYLPCYVGRELGVKNCITQGGLEQMRINGRKEGSWVDATGKNRPRPGDLFYIEAGHVGVIVDVAGNTWKTADAGQGGMGAGQQALYVTRQYDPETNTLGGTGAVFSPGIGWTVRGKPRKLAGWIDIDKVQGATP